jgi:hypothetical protein
LSEQVVQTFISDQKAVQAREESKKLKQLKATAKDGGAAAPKESEELPDEEIEEEGESEDTAGEEEIDVEAELARGSGAENDDGDNLEGKHAPGARKPTAKPKVAPENGRSKKLAQPKAAKPKLSAPPAAAGLAADAAKKKEQEAEEAIAARADEAFFAKVSDLPTTMWPVSDYLTRTRSLEMATTTAPREMLTRLWRRCAALCLLTYLC